MNSTFVSASCRLSWTSNHSSRHLVAVSASDKGCSIHKIRADSSEKVTRNEENERFSLTVGRRSAMVSTVSLVSSAPFRFPGECMAVVKQGLLAGRVPGLSEPDEQGEKLLRQVGEHTKDQRINQVAMVLDGVQSSLIPFLCPKIGMSFTPKQVPVSIADLGGTEIDLRFASPKQGRLSVIVAPCKRFSDTIDDDAKIEQIGPPEKVINAFGPEVIGESVEGKVLSAEIAEHSGRKYYLFELEPPHVLITATAAGNRLYLFSITGKGLQWKRHYKDLKRIAESFRVI